jgi:ABC-2 type transport system permease protein
MILAIAGKDVRDAIRDGRVLVAIVLPLALGVFYNLVFDEAPTRALVSIAYVAAEPTRLLEVLTETVGAGAELRRRAAADREQLERLVATEEVDLGLLIPAGFDAALARGESPELAIVRVSEADFGADYLTAAVEEAVARLAGRPPVATFRVVAVAPSGQNRLIFDRLGTAPYFVITTAVFLIAMIALFVVPVILAEEAEKKTLDALVMVASFGDVIAAKALVGLVYIAVALSLLFALTRARLADRLGFVAAALALSLSLIGIGLLLGGLFRSATQLNTWSSFILLPFIGKILAVGLPLPLWAEVTLGALPTTQGTRLAINTLTGEPFFAGAGLAYLVIAVWGAVAYGLLLWRLARLER